MRRKGNYLIHCLIVSYLLTACQVKQYSYFQASNTVHQEADVQPPVNGQAVEERTEQVAARTADPTVIEEKRLLTPNDLRVIVEKEAIPVVTTDPLPPKAERVDDRQEVLVEGKWAEPAHKAVTSYPRTNRIAIASFVAGLLTFGFLATPLAGITLLAGPAALILGIISYGQIKRRGQRGKGYSVAGLTMGATYILGVVLLFVLLLAAFSSLRF